MDGDKGYPVSLLQLVKVVDKRAERLFVVGVDFGLGVCTNTDYFHEGAILQVKDEWVTERLLQVGAEIRLRLNRRYNRYSLHKLFIYMEIHNIMKKILEIIKKEGI